MAALAAPAAALAKPSLPLPPPAATQPAAKPAEPRHSPRYNPEADVKRMADYFSQKYGSLEVALGNFDRELEFDIYSFEAALKRWGVRVDDVAELFDHIDMDFSGSVSVAELFQVLELPIQELKQREQHRHENEVRRIYELLAKQIREKFGTVQTYFERQRQRVGTSGEADIALGVARFKTLAKDLDVEIEADALQRVFNDLDADGTGTVSMEELQKALSFHLMRNMLIAISKELVARHGTIAEGFEQAFVGHEAAFAGRSPSKGGSQADASPSALLQAAQLPEGAAGAPAPLPPQILSEERFLGLLRRLRIETSVNEAAAHELYAALRPFTLDYFRGVLENANKELEEQQRREKEDERRREKEAERVRQLMRFDSRERAEKEIATWTEKRSQSGAAGQAAWPPSDQRAPAGAAILPGGLVEDATLRWAAATRRGASKAQLKDYIETLQGAVKRQEDEVEELRLSLAREENDLDFLAPPQSFGGLAATPMMAMTPMTATPAGGERFPATPATARAMPKTPKTPAAPSGLQPEPKAARAERVVQAAAVGDVALLQRCLAARTDVNAVAWGGTTPLMAAAFHGRLAALEVLLVRSADLRRTDMRGRTAVDHAHRRPGIRQLLRRHGGRSSSELAAEAEALAQRVLLVGAERARLEEARNSLPSETVRRRAKARQIMQGSGAAEPATPAHLPPTTPAAAAAAAAASVPPPALFRPMWPAALGSACCEGSPTPLAGFGMGRLQADLDAQALHRATGGASRDDAVMQGLMGQQGQQAAPQSCLLTPQDGRPRPEKHVSLLLPGGTF